jgi:hypothetical protein
MGAIHPLTYKVRGGALFFMMCELVLLAADTDAPHSEWSLNPLAFTPIYPVWSVVSYCRLLTRRVDD